MDEGIPRRVHKLTPSCPLRCLKPLLPARAFNPLERALDGPRTVGDVVKLHQEQKLNLIRNLGARGIAEIEAVLAAAGLLSEHDHPYGASRSSRGSASGTVTGE